MRKDNTLFFLVSRVCHTANQAICMEYKIINDVEFMTVESQDLMFILYFIKLFSLEQSTSVRFKHIAYGNKHYALIDSEISKQVELLEHYC